MKICLSCENRFENNDWKCPHCGFIPVRHQKHWLFSPELAKFNNGYDPDCFRKLASVIPTNFWYQTRNKIIVWAMARYFPNAANFLEIGCGTGFVLSGIKQAFPSLEIWGSEIFTDGLTEVYKRIPSASLFQMDARKIPFDSEFDIIGAFDVLEHVEEDTSMLVQMLRAVKPGGGVIITVPQHPFLWSNIDEHNRHKRRYRKKELVQKVEGTGFQILRCSSFVSLLLPLLLLRRKAQSTKYDLREELKISPTLNKLLGAIMKLELLCLKRGYSFPSGGSLLIVAKKIM